MLQLNEEEDDATSKFAELPHGPNPKSEPLEQLEPDAGGLHGGGAAAFLEVRKLNIFKAIMMDLRCTLFMITNYMIRFLSEFNC